jgi:hypothetical protein
VNTIPRTRVAGVWTRLAPNGEPLGRLHAARRIEGALEERALCGFKISERQRRLRPFTIFDETDPKACATCVIETWELP